MEQAIAVQEVLDPDDNAKRCDLLLALGDALVSGGETTRARGRVAPEALRLAEELADRRRASRACRVAQRAIGESTALFLSPEGRRWWQLADRYADEGTVDRIYADVFLGVAVSQEGDSEQALRLNQMAAGLARRLGDPVALVISSIWLLNGNVTPPQAEHERLALAEEIAKLPLAGIDSTRAVNTLLHVGHALLTWGRREEAQRQWERAKEAALRSRDAEMAFVPLQIDALLATLDGGLGKSVAIGAQIRSLGVDLDREQVGRQAGSRAARRSLIYLGRADEALAGILESPNLFLGGGVMAGQRALCLAHVGRLQEARDVLQRMLAARDMGRSDDPTSVSVLKYLLESAVLTKDVSALRVLAGRLVPLAGLLHTQADMAYCIGRLCGGAAALLGEPEKARGYYQQAIEVCTNVRFRPELALTRLELAELLLDEAGAMNRAATGERGGPGSVGARHASPWLLSATKHTEAIAHLDFAIAEFREMKMQPSLERALRHKELLKA